MNPLSAYARELIHFDHRFLFFPHFTRELSGIKRFEQVFYLAPLTVAFRRSRIAPVPRSPHIQAPLIPGARFCFGSRSFREREERVGGQAMLPDRDMMANMAKARFAPVIGHRAVATE